MRFFLRRSFTFLLVAVGGLLLATSPAAHAQTLPSEIVGTTNTFATQPRTDGTYVVWLHLRSGYDWQSETAYYDLYVSNLQSRQPQRIAGDPGSASDPDVDGGVVVWAQSGSDSPIHNRDILAKNLATGEQWTIAATTADETRPAISGNLVVWVSNDGSTTHLIGRYIGTTTQPFIVADLTSTQAMADGDRPALDGTRVVWVDIGDDDAVDGHSYFIRTVVIGSGQSPVTLANIPGSAPTGFDLWGNTVVASIGRQITIFDLATGQQRILPSFGGYPTTDGQYILWQKMYSGGDYRPPTLVGYDLAEDHEMILDDTLNAFGQTPLLQKGIVTYIGKTPESVQGSDNVCIYALTIHQLLTGTQPQATPDPTRSVFPETGHSLGGTFRTYWEHNGGLAVFGYPLSEEILERNADSVQTYTTQYFERQRFELHPENAGTPYEVMLGRLGAQQAAQRNLLNSSAFQPTLARPGNDCDFFSETQHWACGGFRLYWQTHGLEFGDQTFSYRESLALFGVPISESFVDPTTGVMTQYFERARFEYHPENKSPYDILLGRLGAELAPVSTAP